MVTDSIKSCNQSGWSALSISSPLTTGWSLDPYGFSWTARSWPEDDFVISGTSSADGNKACLEDAPTKKWFLIAQQGRWLFGQSWGERDYQRLLGPRLEVWAAHSLTSSASHLPCKLLRPLWNSWTLSVAVWGCAVRVALNPSSVSRPN